MQKISMLCFALTFATLGWAKGNISSIFAHQYYQTRVLGINPKAPPPNNCRPQSSCFRVACDILGQFECDDLDEQTQVRNACRGVWGGDCITNASRLLGSFECDDLEEMVKLVQSCNGVFDLECVNYSCQRLGRFGCDDLEEVVQINRSCSQAYPYYN